MLYRSADCEHYSQISQDVVCEVLLRAAVLHGMYKLEGVPV
jgi:hypothetical protein